MVKDVGLTVVDIKKESAFMEQLEGSHDPLLETVIQKLPENTYPKDYITSLKLAAEKPLV